MKALERGFKAWADRTAVGIRRELNLSVHDRLDPFEFASKLDITIWVPTDVPGISDELLSILLVEDPSGWSATTFEVNGRCTIIYNPKHSLARQYSDVMHELAHQLLTHKPATIILSASLTEFSLRTFDQKQEDEANCLAWTILLPREGLLAARLKKKTVEEIAEQFGVSTTLVRFRLNSTGIERQLSRRRPFGF